MSVFTPYLLFGVLAKAEKKEGKKKHLLKALKKNTEYSDCININILKTLPGCPSSKKKKNEVIPHWND